MTDPSARTLALLALLQSGGEWSGSDLAVRLGISPRSLRRDVDRLRRLGYAVDARPGPGGRYRLAPGTRVPPLLFEDDEITAVVAGLRRLRTWLPDDDAAQRALAKLEQVLPDRLRRHAAATDLAVEVLDETGPAAGITSRAAGVIADAVAGSGRIRFAYRDQHGTVSTRTVDPYRHVLSRGRWYLVAYDLDRQDWRLFRFDRVRDVERVPGVFETLPFPDVSLQRWFETDFGRVPPP